MFVYWDSTLETQSNSDDSEQKGIDRNTFRWDECNYLLLLLLWRRRRRWMLLIHLHMRIIVYFGRTVSVIHFCIWIVIHRFRVVNFVHVRRRQIIIFWRRRWLGRRRRICRHFAVVIHFVCHVIQVFVMIEFRRTGQQTLYFGQTLIA